MDKQAFVEASKSTGLVGGCVAIFLLVLALLAWIPAFITGLAILALLGYVFVDTYREWKGIPPKE